MSVYAQEDGPKNGNYAPSFHIIEHVIYHTSLDVPGLVPAGGLQRSTRAFVAALDRANTMTMTQLRGTNFPPKPGQARSPAFSPSRSNSGCRAATVQRTAGLAAWRSLARYPVSRFGNESLPSWQATLRR